MKVRLSQEGLKRSRRLANSLSEFVWVELARPLRAPALPRPPVKLRVICRFQGLILLLVAGSMLPALAVSLLYDEGDAPAFAVSFLATAVVGLALWYPTRDPVRSIGRRESFATVTLGWILVPAFGALPFLLAGTFDSHVDAYFEAMSGFTTTGASVLANIEAEPHGVLFWRSLTQWLGGMGIIVLFVAILPKVGVGAAQMFENEASGPISERLTPRIRQQAKALWLIYVAMSAVLLVLLLLRGLSPFDSFAHMFSTMATGGFSPRNESVGAFGDPTLEFITTFFMVASGVNFGLYYALWRRRGRQFFLNRELLLYVAIIGGTTVLILFDLVDNAGHGAADAFRLSVFQVASIQTGTGFATADFGQWPPLSHVVLIVLMLVGGCAGSTTGAIKVIRVYVLIKHAHRQISTVFQPRAVLPLKMAGKPIPDRAVAETMGFLTLYVLLLTGATLFVAAFEHDLVTSVTAVAATLGNVGPGLALVGPAANYSSLPDPVKVVLTFCMLAGRLEFWALFVLLRPGFWKA